jgi:hypothetical protein
MIRLLCLTMIVNIGHCLLLNTITHTTLTQFQAITQRVLWQIFCKCFGVAWPFSKGKKPGSVEWERLVSRPINIVSLKRQPSNWECGHCVVDYFGQYVKQRSSMSRCLEIIMSTYSVFWLFMFVFAYVSYYSYLTCISFTIHHFM